jgi:hypothetical protein
MRGVAHPESKGLLFFFAQAPARVVSPRNPSFVPLKNTID